MAASAAGCACPRKVRVLSSSLLFFFSPLLCRGSLYVWGRRPRIERRHLSTNRTFYDMPAAERFGRVRRQGSSQLPTAMRRSGGRGTHHKTQLQHSFGKSFCANGHLHAGRRRLATSKCYSCDVAGARFSPIYPFPPLCKIKHGSDYDVHRWGPRSASPFPKIRSGARTDEICRIAHYLKAMARPTLHGGGVLSDAKASLLALPLSSCCWYCRPIMRTHVPRSSASSSRLAPRFPGRPQIGCCDFPPSLSE